MNVKLCRPCLALWLLGIAGMWVARAYLHLDVEALPFQLAAGLWILGGIGYTGFGLLTLATTPSGEPPHGG